MKTAVAKTASVSKKASSTKNKHVVLRPANVRIKGDLGNGFYRWVLNSLTIAPNSFLTITLYAGTGRRVISAGWYISGTENAWAAASYAATDSSWVLRIANPSSVARTITPVLITKLS